jgi:hypothetical protein
MPVAVEASACDLLLELLDGILDPWVALRRALLFVWARGTGEGRWPSPSAAVPRIVRARLETAYFAVLQRQIADALALERELESIRLALVELEFAELAACVRTAQAVLIAGWDTDTGH